MRITDLLKKESIELKGKVSNKAETLDKMVELMVQSGNISDKEKYKKGVYAREAEGTTGVGEGIAIPHAKTDAVKRPGLSAMVIGNGVDYDSLDGNPVDLVFLIAAPNSKENVHLDVLSRLSVLLMDENFTSSLRKASTKEEFLDIINKAETAKYGKEEINYNEQANLKDAYRIVAVTACPTGIAHTYMAAESLENKAKALGVNIKVETDGSGGAKNVLTEEDIAKADCVIIAADKNVEMARFNGKKVIKTKVADGIHKADALIKDAMAGKGSVFYAEGGSEKSEKTTGGDSIGHTIYKHLMSGVSHMLPFVIGGGILISLAFLFDNYEIDPSNFGSNTPLAAFLKTIGGTAFGFMLPILSGFIAMSIAERPGLAIGFVGGAIANAGVTFTNPSGGISAGFLGALIAGFAAGYLVVGLRKLFSKLPKSLEGIKPILLYPVLGLLFIGIIVAFINPGVAAINTAMNDALASMSGTSKVLLGVVLGGMMSIDMGGPFNKAAYVFGTAGLASGEFEIMAAVMAGGMVPPLAIALSATFFRNRYKKSERESALVNYIMGLSFITEGAIPFAAADPIRVLPSCIIGSSIAGGLSVLFGCGLRAPHGGLFVVPVVSNPFGYLAAIAIGAVVGALLLGVLKKPVEE
ncbi:MAG: fructose transporter subunit [Lachnospiraceae bacterium]|jgi:PTS system fructose-specific IIC component|nr:fructose transporter subunit [Lachnospiraceae bacterium]